MSVPSTNNSIKNTSNPNEVEKTRRSASKWEGRIVIRLILSSLSIAMLVAGFVLSFNSFGIIHSIPAATFFLTVGATSFSMLIFSDLLQPARAA